MSRELVAAANVLNEVTATGYSAAIDVKNIDYITVEFAGTDTSVFTGSVKGAIGNTAPNFSNAASPSNPYDLVGFKKINSDGTVIAGATGVAFTADGVTLIELNVKQLDWISVGVSAYTSGTISARVLKGSQRIRGA